MDEEENGPPPSRFRVVDKRISSRSDAPAATPDTGAGPPSAEPPPSTPPPQAEQPEPNPEPEAATPEAAPPPPGGAGEGQGEHIWTPEQEAEARAFLEHMTQTPSIEWVVNTALTLANVAGAKLDGGKVADAQLVIDALAALVEKLGSRLDQAEAPLRQTVAQLQLAYSQMVTQQQNPAGPPAP